MTTKNIVVDESTLISSFATNAELVAALGVQMALISGTNIKTINGASVLGSGDLPVSGSAAWGSISGTLSSQTDLQNALNAKQASGSYATGTGTANGTNTGDQTNIVGITGTIAQFNTACTDADFATGGGTATGNNTGDQSTVSGSSGSCTGNAATATKLAATKTINGTAFDGSANIDAVPTWKCGQTTRDISTASGAQNIAHGLGRVPKLVHITARMVFSAAVSEECNATYDGTSQSGQAIIWTEGTTTATSDNIYSSTAAALGLSNAGGVNPFTGATKASGVITVDATNIIITWTKSGSPTGTAQLAWEVT